MICLPSGLNATLLTVELCPLRVRNLLASGRVPDFDRCVCAPAGNLLAVGAERHAKHWARVPDKRPLILREQRAQVAMLPSPKVFATGVEAIPCDLNVVGVPIVLGIGDIATVKQPVHMLGFLLRLTRSFRPPLSVCRRPEPRWRQPGAVPFRQLCAAGLPCPAAFVPRQQRFESRDWLCLRGPCRPKDRSPQPS